MSSTAETREFTRALAEAAGRIAGVKASRQTEAADPPEIVVDFDDGRRLAARVSIINPSPGFDMSVLGGIFRRPNKITPSTP